MTTIVRWRWLLVAILFGVLLVLDGWQLLTSISQSDYWFLLALVLLVGLGKRLERIEMKLDAVAKNIPTTE